MTGLEVLAAWWGGAVGVALGLQSIRTKQRHHQSGQELAIVEAKNEALGAGQREIVLAAVESLGASRALDQVVVEQARMYADVAAGVDAARERTSAHDALMEMWGKIRRTPSADMASSVDATILIAASQIVALGDQIELQTAAVPGRWPRNARTLAS